MRVGGSQLDECVGNDRWGACNLKMQNGSPRHLKGTILKLLGHSTDDENRGDKKAPTTCFNFQQGKEPHVMVESNTQQYSLDPADCSWELQVTTSDFHSKKFLQPCSFIVKFGCCNLGLSCTFLEPQVPQSRVLLCIWFPHHMGVLLTLLKIEPLSEPRTFKEKCTFSFLLDNRIPESSCDPGTLSQRGTALYVHVLQRSEPVLEGALRYTG